MRRLLSVLLTSFLLWSWARAKPAPGRASAPAPAATTPSPSPATHAFASGPRLWIYGKPRRSPHPIGYLRAGASAELVQADPVARRGCGGGWYAIQPFGFVCLRPYGTLDGQDRYVRALGTLAPRPDPLPFSYALSNGTPMYRRLPSELQASQAERWFGKAGSFRELFRGHSGHAQLAVVRRIHAQSRVPFFLADGGSAVRTHGGQLVRRTLPLGSTVAYTHAFEHQGRTWLASADGTAVPANRVRPFRASAFHGTPLGVKRKLPVAWVRRTPAPRYRMGANGEMLPTGGHWPVRSLVELALPLRRVTHEGREYLAARSEDAGALFIGSAEASLVRAHTPPASVPDHGKWIRFSITAGTLVAYEGTTAVYTTLASPGAGGVPRPGRDLIKWSTTPLGIYTINFKHLADDMSPDEGEDRKFWLAEVPYTQYFRQPFAVHTAYWHERFGEPMSAGCINLSPQDGKWLFDWTSPTLPKGWGGVGVGEATGKGTPIVIVR